MKNIYTNKVDLDTLERCIESDISTLLIGETGTGKTTILKSFAKEKGKRITRVSLNGNTGTEEILGKFLLDEGKTKWQDGILTRAVRNGSWIVFDEINSASPEILFALHALLDEEKALVLPAKDNERISAHKDFRFFASMNPEDYAGTKTLNQAFMSRFCIININVMNESDEIEFLINKIKISETRAISIVSIAVKLRAMKQAQEIDYFCSTRDLEMVGLLLSKLSLENAFKVAVFNKMNLMEKEVVIEKSSSYAKFIDNNRNSLDGKIKELKDLKIEVAKFNTKKKELEDMQGEIDVMKKETSLQLSIIDTKRKELQAEEKKIDEIINKRVQEKIKSLLS